jgi:hypothetical protein
VNAMRITVKCCLLRQNARVVWGKLKCHCKAPFRGSTSDRCKIVQRVHGCGVQLGAPRLMSGRFTARQIRHPVTMQVGALGIEPSLGSFVIRK